MRFAAPPKAFADALLDAVFGPRVFTEREVSRLTSYLQTFWGQYYARNALKEAGWGVWCYGGLRLPLVYPPYVTFCDPETTEQWGPYGRR